MLTKDDLEHLARMSRLFARVETNPMLAARFTELAGEYDEKARQTPDEASIDCLPLPLTARGDGHGDENKLH